MRTDSTTLLCLACYKDRLAAVCENADEYLLFEIREGKIYPAGLLSLPSKDPMDRTSAILACGVSFFVCGAICNRPRNQLEKGGVTVLPWLSGGIDTVLEAFMSGALESLIMPGCPNQVGRRRRKGADAGSVNMSGAGSISGKGSARGPARRRRGDSSRDSHMYDRQSPPSGSAI